MLQRGLILKNIPIQYIFEVFTTLFIEQKKPNNIKS